MAPNLIGSSAAIAPVTAAPHIASTAAAHLVIGIIASSRLGRCIAARFILSGSDRFIARARPSPAAAPRLFGSLQRRERHRTQQVARGALDVAEKAAALKDGAKIDVIAG